MFHIILHQPAIPPNTGNILRLAHNTGCTVGLIEPLGFLLNDKQLSRAGLDYIDQNILTTYEDFDSFLNSLDSSQQKRIFFATTKTKQNYTDIKFQANDILMFGSETHGIPENILNKYPKQTITIPMQENSRSLNLSNSVSIIVYEAWRQLGFITK